MRRALGGIVLAAALSGCSAGGDGVGSGGAMTCDDLAGEAVGISSDRDVRLLKVRAPEVEIDKQKTGWDEPMGAGEVTILRCLGAGVWSDGTDTNVRLELSVDADGDAFVSYEQTH